MVTLNESGKSKTYLTMGINGNGQTTLRQEVSEDTVGAVRREWSVGDKSGVKHELTFDDIEGKISGIEIKKEERKGFGDKVYITFEDEIVVTTDTKGKFGQSILRQLPNVDFTQPVKLRPYSYTPKGKDKESTGVSLKQGENFEDKVGDFFFDFDKMASKNGIPEPDFDWSTVEKWHSDKFWTEVDKFLQEYTIENVIPNIPEFKKEETAEPSDPLAAEFEEDEEVNPEDIPFDGDDGEEA